MIFLGIDPGKQGAVGGVNDKNAAFILAPTPATGKDYNIPEMASWLRLFAKGHISLAVIERATAMPGQGVVSMFEFGKGYGIWLGLLGALGIPYQIVSASVWTRVMLAGAPGKGKDRGYFVARRLFPKWNPKLKKERGYADALLLAEFSRRLHQGQVH